MVKILKASAGSGKTFRLAKKYLELIFSSDDRYAYRHILAVTFTNKATAEMKNRILGELDTLAREPEKSGYIEDFVRMFGSAADIKAKAAQVLSDILHDYGAFSVSTIDKFFQQALRSFAREIGQFASYQVELDSESLVGESVDRMLDSLSADDRVLLPWLTRYALKGIEDSGRYVLENSLYEVANNLKSKELKAALDRSGVDPAVFFSRENLDLVEKACRECVKAFNDDCKASACEVLAVFDSAGISPEDTKGGFMKKIRNYADPDPKASISRPTDAFIRNCMDSDCWFKKGDASLRDALDGRLNGPLSAFCDLFGTRFKEYEAALELESKLFGLGIAADFYEEFEALAREKNVMSIDDSDTLLRRIIGESDAPFVYEKLGVRYDNFLLDEFQDTSHLQWENFKPLLKESVARGNSNLVVGDVKQSIYRWRDADWSLLDSGVKKDFPEADDSENLRDNRRSLRNIVEFNNSFFPYAASILDKRSSGGTPVSDIYGTVEQHVCRESGPGGYLRFTFCESGSIAEEVYRSIGRIISSGGRPGEIAILVRKNQKGSEIASYLAAKGVKVISNDSLSVKSSHVVRLLVSCLSLTARPEDRIGSYEASSFGLEAPPVWNSIPALCEDILRRIKEMLPEEFEEQVLYIQSFMDSLMDWSSTGGNNLAGFLSHWEEADPKISSPDDPDAVQIVTIHKSKGLEFPYVIFPAAEDVGIYRARNNEHWCSPDLKGTSLEGKAEGVYFENLSSKWGGTVFEKAYLDDLDLQLIDNINTFYVALTRPECGLHVISSSLTEKSKDQVLSPDGGFKFQKMSEILYLFLREYGFSQGLEYMADGETEVFEKGMLEQPERRKKSEADVKIMKAAYPSYPLNPVPGDPDADIRERGRLKFSSDSVEFFSGEISPRKRGNILHSILSMTDSPRGLSRAVERVAASGDIPEAEIAEYEALLRRNLADPRVAEWFPEDKSKVRNEVSVMDTKGEVHRPDRVVETPGGLVVIDYKSGEPRGSYARQVRTYMELYRRMGASGVRGFLWYLDREAGEEGSIVEVD